MSQFDPALWQTYAAFGGLAVTVVGLALVIMQLRQVELSLRSSAHAALYEQASSFRTHLVAYPHLRRFFFEGASIEPSDADYDRVITIAELFLNHLEQIAVTIKSLGRDNRAALESFIKDALDKSPMMKQHLAANRSRYSPALIRYISSGVSVVPA